MIHPNDKAAWCEAGAEAELAFVERMQAAGYRVRMNPDKEKDKYTYDLLLVWHGEERPADLKTRDTPFLKSKELYGIDSAYAVTLNVADCKRYAKLYPNIVIIFDVRYAEDVRIVTLDGLRDLYRDKRMPIHRYKTRDGEDGNKVESFVIDIRSLPPLLHVCQQSREEWLRDYEDYEKRERVP